MITIDADGVLHIRLVGRWPSEEESAEVREALQASELWHPDRPVLMDLRDVDLHDAPHYEELRARVFRWGTLVSPPPRMAVLAIPGGVFAMARMIEQIYIGEAEAFLSQDAALAWLARPRGPSA